MSNGFIPRNFEPTDDDKVICDEDMEIAEMYFIQDGFIGIGFSLIGNGITGRSYCISKKQQGNQIICDHYVINKRKSTFIYMVLEYTRCFALSSKFLHGTLFPKYPDFEVKVKASSYTYYKKWIYKPIIEHNYMEIQSINKKKQTHREIHIQMEKLQK